MSVYEALQALKEGSEKLTDSEKILVSFFQNQGPRLAEYTLDDITASTYVSQATIVRLCKKLGYTGWREFRVSLKQNALHIDKSVLVRAREQRLSQTTAYARTVIQQVDSTALIQLAQRMLESRYLYLYGRELSSIPAEYLQMMLTTMDVACTMIDWLEAFKRSLVPPGSCVVLFGTYFRERDYAELLRALHECGAYTVLICTHEPEVAELADAWYRAPDDGASSCGTSKLGSFLLIQLLLEAVAQVQ